MYYFKKIMSTYNENLLYNAKVQASTRNEFKVAGFAKLNY